MANKFWKDMTVAIDDSTGTLTAITDYVNNASLAAALDLLEDTVLSDEERGYAPGLAGATLPLNGWVNSTTEGIFGPLAGNRTSLTKTAEFYNGVKYYNGETWVGDLEFSGQAGQLQTWSATLTFDGAVTRTSVTLVAG